MPKVISTAVPNPLRWLCLSTRWSVLASAGLSCVALSACSAPPPPIQVLAELSARPGNPAVTADGRLLFSQHPMDDPVFKVVELRSDGEIAPFPTLSWSRDRLGSVIGIEARSNGLVWMLDMGGNGVTPKLIAWDVEGDSLAHQIQIPDAVTTPDSFLQDLAVVERYGVVVIADMTLPGPFENPEPALIVVDIEMGTARRVLQGHASFMPTLDEVTVAGSRLETVTKGGDVRALRLALNPISIDPRQDWLYYGAVSGERVYRIPASALVDPDLTEEDLAGLIEDYAEKPACDGFRVDGRGRVFVTDVAGNGVGIATPDGYELAISDAEALAWPDGLAFDSDGAVIVTVNQLHGHPALNGGEDESRPPYWILRLNDVTAAR